MIRFVPSTYMLRITIREESAKQALPHYLLPSSDDSQNVQVSADDTSKYVVHIAQYCWVVLGSVNPYACMSL